MPAVDTLHSTKKPVFNYFKARTSAVKLFGEFSLIRKGLADV